MEELRRELIEAKKACISSWIDEVSRKIDLFHENLKQTL